MKFERKTSWSVEHGLREGEIVKIGSEKIYYWRVVQQQIDLGFGHTSEYIEVDAGATTSLQQAKKAVKSTILSPSDQRAKVKASVNL